jgi:hypothetical protein
VRRAIAAAGIALALAAVTTPVAHAGDAPQPLLSAEAEAYAMRVEYDLPVPAGSGTVAHVDATAQRSASVESGHGLAAAPTQFDAVVGGKFADPAGSGHAVNHVPQVECNSPSDDPTHVFRFPTDTSSQEASSPATSYAYASCGAGPSVELRAHVGDPTAAAAKDPSAAVAPAAAESSGASIRPDKGVLNAEAASTAQGLALAGGLITIGSVSAYGASATAGTPGTASSTANVAISDIRAGGVAFSLTFTGVGPAESVTVAVAGKSVPLGDAAGQAVLAAANQALAATGCSMTVTSDPARYPEGFLFSRPQPDLGVKDDGSLAASYRGGLLVVCDVPDNPVATATKFSPERFQALIGFVYTSVAAQPGTDIGGFGLGDLGGTPGATALPAAVTPTQHALGLGPSATVVPVGGAPAAASPAAATASTAAPPSIITSFLRPLPAGARWTLLVSCLALWAWLTHLGIARLLGIGARDEDSQP